MPIAQAVASIIGTLREMHDGEKWLVSVNRSNNASVEALAEPIRQIASNTGLLVKAIHAFEIACIEESTANEKAAIKETVRDCFNLRVRVPRKGSRKRRAQNGE